MCKKDPVYHTQNKSTQYTCDYDKLNIDTNQVQVAAIA